MERSCVYFDDTAIVKSLVKLNTGFFLSPGQAFFLGVRSDTTNLSYLLMPLPSAGLEF